MNLDKRTLVLLGCAALGTSAAFSLQTAVQQPVAGIPAPGTPGGPRYGLTGTELEQFKRGRDLFDKNFHKTDGVGLPEMNADSCRACHQDPVMGGAGPLELNVSRFGFDDNGAGPFMDLPGGQAASKLRPPYAVGREEIPANADVFEQRQTPSLLGAGLIDLIYESAILANEDPTDSDSDGVFGVARMVDVGGNMEVGRFGWKAQIPMLGDFLKDAMGGECGITTPDDGRGFAFITDADSVADPEISQAELDDILFFLSNLDAPQRKGGSVALGESLFDAVGCMTCHVPKLGSPAGQVRLYSDLLLHNVQEPGFRGMAEPGAGVGMYRTPPLWGIGETAPYMHDGRAEDLPAAIGAHYGEALAAKNAFLALSPADRQAVIDFLEDL